MPIIEIRSQPAKPLHIENDDALAASYGQALAALVMLATAKPTFQPLSVDREAARKCGQAIFESGSHAGMQVAMYLIQSMWAHGRFGKPSENTFHPRELEMAWDGIGVWLG